MNEFRITPQALVNVVIASGLALLFSFGSFSLLTTIGGITLLLILFSYDQGAQRSGFQSLAFGAVCALPFTLAAGMLLQQVAGQQNVKMGLSLTWLCATILATAIDRSRMGARATQAPYPVSQVAAPAPQQQHVSPPSRYGLGLGGSAPAPEIHTPVHAEPPPPPAYTPPVPAAEPPPTYYQPAPIPTPPPAPPPPPAPVQSQPAFVPAPTPPVAPPPPIAAVNPAAVTIIHVNIIGQGISLLRPVQAEHIARDIYRIIEIPPEGERWKYETGQAVRCHKQKLSSGKALVAYEEVILQRVG
jgi:hypothetical protein